jgi:glycosyltransferase 2 family protein
MTLTAAVLLAAFLLPVVLAAPAVLVGLLLFALPAFSGRLLKLIPEPAAEAEGLRQRLLQSTRAMIGKLEYLSYDKPLLVLWSLFTMAIFVVAGLQFWILAEGLGGGLSFFEALFAYCSSQFLGIISLLPLGLGVADGSLVEISSRLGLETQRAVALAVLVRATITLPLIIAALIAYFHLLLQRSVRQPDEIKVVDESAPVRSDEASPLP